MLPVPYIGPVERPITSWGLTVRISGQSPSTARRFNVNFQCGPSLNPRDDVAFHLAVDFEGQCIITNSILGNQWGPQECDSRNFPFHHGSQFVIDIICEQPAFRVNVNNMRTVRFEHRIEPSQITHLAIDGDIILQKIEYIDGARSGGPIGFSVPSTNPHILPYPSSTLPPYSAIPSVGGYSQQSYQTPYPNQPAYVPQQCPSPNPALYSQQPGLYPQQHSSYPQQPSSYPQQPNLYPQQPGMNTQQSYGGRSPNTQHKQKGLLDKIGLGGAATGGVLGTVATGAAGLYGLKHMKKQAKISKKAQKKALKYGLPIAGVGLGAYALHKTKFGFGSSSSSSSSSDSD